MMKLENCQNHGLYGLKDTTDLESMQFFNLCHQRNPRKSVIQTKSFMPHSKQIFSLAAQMLLIVAMLSALPASAQQISRMRTLALVEEADELYAAGNLHQADSLIELALSSNHQLAGAYFLRAKIHEAFDQKLPALVAYEAALALDIEHKEARFKAAQIHYEQKNYTKALEHTRFLLQNTSAYNTTTVFFQQDIDGDNVGLVTVNKMKVDIFQLAGLCYLALENYDKAIAYFKYALQHNPQEVNAYNNLGLAYLSSQDSVLAKEAFSKALQVNIQDQAALYNLSLLQEDQKMPMIASAGRSAVPTLLKSAYENYVSGAYDSAIYYYAIAVKYDSTNAMAWMDYGRAKSKVGAHIGAIAMYEKSLRLDGSLTKNHHLMGNAYFKTQRYADAIEAYRQYLVFNYQDPEGHYNLGLSLLQNKQKAEACHHLQKAYDLGLEAALKPLNSVCL